MAQAAEPENQSPSARRSDSPIWWWALTGAWVGLFALDRALTGGGRGPFGSWMNISIGLILLGPYLPSLFYDADGQEYVRKGMWSAAKKHWSGVVGLLLMVVGVGLIVANMATAPDTLRPLDWGFAVACLLMPVAALVGVNGPRVRFPIGELVAILVVVGVLFGGSILYGSRLQWAYAQLDALIFEIIGLLVAMGFGVLRFMDWMIARSEHREN